MFRTLPARRLARPLASVAVLALVSLAAAGCGDDGGDATEEVTTTVTVDADGNLIDGGSGGDDTGDDDGDDAGPPLTQEQLEVVVLTPENLGEGWTGGTVPSDEDGSAPGCFAEIDAISDALDPQEVAEHDVEYAFGDEGLPSVSSGASSYAEEGPVADAFTQLKDVLDACTTVTGADSDGTEWDVAVTYDDATISDATDEQINLTATGTLTDSAGSSFEVSLHSAYVRIGRNVITVATSDLVDQSAVHAEYVTIGVDRFIDVIIDSEPADTTAPAPA